MKYKQIEDKTLKQLHEVEMEILDEIDRVCKKNNINYFLTGGTLLGAVRHQGFIPWDDDMDIGMFRRDYDKFLEVAKRDLKKEYFLHTESTDPNYWLTFSKVRKNNTLFLEKANSNINNIQHSGIFVDIFPFDNASKLDSKRQHVNAAIVKLIVDALFYKSGVYSNTKRCNHPRLVRMFSVLSIKQLHKLKNKIMTGNNDDNSKYIICYATGFSYPRDTHLRSSFAPFKLMKFENRKYWCPNDPDAYLKKGYGDYMKLPDPKDRVNHEALDVVFDTSKNK